jgi:hypothetical protein
MQMKQRPCSVPRQRWEFPGFHVAEVIPMKIFIRLEACCIVQRSGIHTLEDKSLRASTQIQRSAKTHNSASPNDPPADVIFRFSETAISALGCMSGIDCSFQLRFSPRLRGEKAGPEDLGDNFSAPLTGKWPTTRRQVDG